MVSAHLEMSSKHTASPTRSLSATNQVHHNGKANSNLWIELSHLSAKKTTLITTQFL